MSIYNNLNFNRFFNGYIECALWSSELDGEDLSFEASEILEAHARSYFARVHFYVGADDTTTPHNGDAWSQLGHDFWLDQNRHGAGARDGHWSVYGKLFAKTAQLYPELNLELDEETGMVDCM